MKKWLSYLFDLIYPNLCVICGESLNKSEQQLCLHCFSKIPKTNYHLLNDNPVEKRFWGKVEIENANSYLFFEKGSQFQKLIHELKYRGNREVGITMGRYAALDLKSSDKFGDIDCLIPVPLHRKKEAQRGYNQSEVICRGIADILEIPLVKNKLYRAVARTSQTRKSVYDRYQNTQGVFKIKNSDDLEGKHVLLVDDVLTTGSTIEACTEALKGIDGLRVSVFTLALSI